jgi:ribose 5-phosphate isomerase A
MSGKSETYKRQAAEKAVELIESGMVVGLGHGSTALFAVRRIGELLERGELREIVGIPCSDFMGEEARGLGIPLGSLDRHPEVDITIDGADEISPELDLIKGGGGALLREKIVAQASRREVIIADDSKLSPALGTNWAVPVEVVPFGWRPLRQFLAAMGASVTVRETDQGDSYTTDGGNMILDADFGPIEDPGAVAARLDGRAAVVEHGLFLGLATDVIVAGPDGIRHMRRPIAD